MHEQRTLSRRGALLGAAALSLGATAAVASAAPASDPVFAAIAEFRARRAAFNAALVEESEYEDVCEARGEGDPAGTPEGRAIEARRDAASDADADAWWDLLNTAPTTREGLCAYLAMLTDKDGYGGGPFPTLEEIEALSASIRAFVMGEAY